MKHDNDKPFQLSRMNYFLVQLSIADLLTTGLTLFPEIGVEKKDYFPICKSGKYILQYRITEYSVHNVL